MSQAQLVPLITFAVIIALVCVRLVRMSREQRFRPGGMWVLPIFFAAFTAWLVMAEGFTSPIDLALMLVALAAGVGIGWYQGTHTTVRVDHAAHAMFVKISPLGGFIWIAVLLLRLGVRYATGGIGASSLPPDPLAAAPSANGPTGLISMTLLVLAVGVIAGLRAYLQRVYALERAAL